MQSLILLNSLIDVCITEVYQTACSLYVQSSHDFFSEFRKFKISTKLGDKLGFFEPAHSLHKPHDGKKILVIIGYDTDDAFFELMKYQDVDLSHYHVFISPAPTSFAMSHVKNVIEYNVYCSLLDYLNNNDTANIGITIDEITHEIFNDNLRLSIDLPEYRSDFNYDNYVMFQYPYYAFLADKFLINKKIGIEIPFITDAKHPFYMVIDEASNSEIKLVVNEEHVHSSLFANFIDLFNKAIYEGDLPLFIDPEYKRIFELLNDSMESDILHDELECDTNVVDKKSRRSCLDELTIIINYNNYLLNKAVSPQHNVGNRLAKNKSFLDVYFDDEHKLIVKGKCSKPTVNIINDDFENNLELLQVEEYCWNVNFNVMNPLIYKINLNEGVINFNYLSDD